ncbi:hypothetical protein ACF0H5_002356 [Mactra antiquata]
MSRRFSSLYPWNWWPGSGGDTAHKTEINLEELAGDIDDVLIGLFRSIDLMHAATQNHMFKLKQFIEDIAEENRGPASGIKLSVNCLKDAESSLLQNRNMVLKVFERIKEESQNTKSSIRDQMSQTFNYLEEDDIPEDYSGINDNDESTQQSQIIENLVKRVTDLEKQIDEPKQEFTIVSLRSRVRVQVYNCRDNVKKFVEDLLKQVNEELDVLYITHASEISQTSPLLVICFNTSGLGTVADNAIREISALRSAVLLVFHHKESHALPSQHSDKRLVGDRFSSLYGIFDIACVTGKGVYPHDMNTQAVSKVKQYIEQYNYCIMENETVAK